MLKITRHGNSFAAQAVSYTAIFHCAGGRNAELEPAIGKALSSGTLIKVKSVRLDPHEADETCAVHSNELCLSLT
jgi:hypothetical protein